MGVAFNPKYLSYYAFYKEAFKVIEPATLFVPNWHIVYLCDCFQKETYRIKAGKKKEKDLIVNVPFRSSKSLIATIAWNAWSWIINPSMGFITVSYSASLSASHSRKTRNLILSNWYQTNFGHLYTLAQDQKSKSRFETNKNGLRFATSMTGTGTGEGGDVVLIDDPTNPKESNSDAERTAANTNFDETFYSRVKNPATAVRIIIMHRAHVDDLTGHVLKKYPKNWRHIKIPGTSDSEIKPSNLKKFYKDGCFWEKRFGQKQLKEFEKAIGSYAFAGQIQQDPAPLGGGYWKQWFVILDNIPKNIVNVGVDWDLAYTKEESNSGSAYVVSGQIGNKIFIIDAGCVYKEFPDLIKFMSNFTYTHYVEGKASGKSAVQTLKSNNINAIEVNGINKDKISRTLDVIPVAEGGRIYTTSKVANYIYFTESQGILKFPNNTHNDLNDALTQAIKRQTKRISCNTAMI